MVQDPSNDDSTLGQVMIMVPSCNKPFTEPMLTKVYDAIWLH